MNPSREQLDHLSSETGFRPEVLEKVIKLLTLLEGLRKHPYLKDRLVLKGGTALNAFLFELPRLSADADLNYIGSPDVETMRAERPNVEKAIEAVCTRIGLRVHICPDSHLGGKWHLRYPSAVGGEANLEIDLSFGYRVPLFSVPKRDSFALGPYKAADISVLDIHELAGGKLAALLARDAARDVFDVCRLFDKHSDQLDQERLRISFVVYGAMNRKDWREASVGDIDYDAATLKNELAPFVRKDDADELSIARCEEMIDRCRSIVGELLPFTQGELEFLESINGGGEIRPELLSDDEDLQQRIRQQPLLRWKAMNVQKYLENQE